MRTPVTVVGGYLGAGKTTLVNHLLRNAHGLRIAILVNDFGTLPIDADLIEAQSEDLISIAGGCVCCSFGSDLMGALMTLAQRAPAPDHVLIETSGVAMPGIVARSAALLPALSIDSVVVLADAQSVRARASDRYMGDTITRQLAEADLVVLNKADLVDRGALPALRDWIRQQAPRAAVIVAEHSRVSLDAMLGLARRSPAPQKAFTSGFLEPPADAASTYESVSLTPMQPLDVDALARALASPACGLIRAKGVLRDVDGTLKTLHLAGPRCEVSPSPSRFTKSTGLACIGVRGVLDRYAIDRALAHSTTLP